MTIVGSPASSLMFASRILRSRKEVTLVSSGRTTKLSGVLTGGCVVSEGEEGFMMIVEMWKWGVVEVEATGSSPFMSLSIDKFRVSLPVCLVCEPRAFFPSLVSPLFKISPTMQMGCS